MINRIVRKILLKILGDEKYLTLVSNIFLKMYHSGKARKNYPEMYLLKKLISEGNVCIDIGANLGYYSVPLAELVGNSGKVFAVEPVELFRKILSKNLKKYKVEKNIEVIPYALGNTDGTEIEMGTPEVNGLVHFGYTKILSPGNHPHNILNTYKAKIYKPQTLFGDLKELHFIKCDIEGYEDKVIPEFIQIIEKFKPSLQIEINSKRNREIIVKLLKSLKYDVFYFLDDKLHILKELEDNLDHSADLYFLQPETIASMQALIKK